MPLNTDQKASRNFKKLLGIGETNVARDYFQEPYLGKPSVYNENVWGEAESIPTTAPVLAPDAVSGVVQYKEDLALVAVGGTSNSFYSADLIDAIPSGFGDGSYVHSLKNSLGSAIPFGSGDWVVDADAGTVTFYGTVPANMPPTITFYKYVGVKGPIHASGSDISVGELDYRSLAAETVARSIYIDPAGNDTTGDGSIGLPFFSLQRAFDDIKPVINGVEIKICVNDGTYDFSTLDNLVIDKICLGATGYITIIPTSGIASPLGAFTTLSSGTFTSYSNNEHTIAPDPGWVVDTYKNKFLEVTSMLSGGALPTLGSFFTFRVMPIYKNTSDTIHCGYTGLSGTQALDFKDFNIVEHKVKFNFGSKLIYTKMSCPARALRFQFFEINAYGLQQMDSEDRVSMNAPYLFFSNCNITFTSIFRGTSYHAYNTYLKVSDFHVPLCIGYNNVHEQAYYSSSASYPAAFYTTGQWASKIVNQIINQTSGTKRAGVSVFAVNNVDTHFSGYLKFVNCTSGIHLERDGLFLSSATIAHDTTNFTVRINGSSRIINSGTLTFVNEPAVGRLTLDGTNAATKYYDAELEINALAIAPDSYKELYQGLLPLDFRSLAAETANRTIYVDPAGSDTTGDGSIGLPFFSLHRALKDIKPAINNCEVTILAANGTYDYSSLGPLLIEKSGMYAAIYIKNVTTVIDDAFASLTVPITGTFIDNTTNRYKHTCTVDPGWAADSLVGKFIKLTSTTYDAKTITGSSKYIPITRNGSDWIEHPAISFSSTSSYRWQDFEIVDHTVVFNFGSNNVSISLANTPRVDFTGIKILTTGHFIHGNASAHLTEFITPTPSLFMSCTLDVKRLLASCDIFSNSFLRVTQYYVIAKKLYYTSAISSYAAAVCYNTEGHSMIMIGAMIRSTNGVSTQYGINYSPASTKHTMAGCAFINVKAGAYITDKTNLMVYYDFYFVDTLSLFYVPYKNNLISSPSTISAVFLNEPSLGRLTFDNTTAATQYYNAETGLNALAIAPDAYKYITTDPASNEDVDTGTEIVDSIPDVTGHGSCMWHYRIVDSGGTNSRSGLVIADWNAATDTVNITDGMSVTAGTVTATFSAAIAADVLELSVTVPSDDWKVYVDRVSTL